VSQGADERKPLFSLFVMPGRTGKEREWIGWHPLGPYDASSLRAEEHLGWHFNTGDPKKPAPFALAGEHRREYYRKGLLERLRARGVLVGGEAEIPGPARIFVRVDEGGEKHLPPRASGVLLVRQSRVTVEVDIHDQPLSTLSRVTW